MSNKYSIAGADGSMGIAAATPDDIIEVPLSAGE
jgi:hypothetical protein